MEKDYVEFLKLLNKHKVKYCVIGAYALAYYATPRYTKDIDVFLEQSRENAKKTLKALNDFGFSKLNLKIEDFMDPGITIQLGYEPVRIDLVTSIDGCSFGQIWKNRKKGKFGKENVLFIGLNDLIRNKRASKRTQDIADLDLLAQVSKNKKKRKKR